MNLGAGPDKINGVLSVDINPKWKPDILDDIRTLKKVKDNSVDEFFATNVLEHIAQCEVKQILKLWYNKLKDNGKILILVPNLKIFCTLWVNGYIEEEWGFKALYSSHKSLDTAEHHKSGYSRKYLTKLLFEAGFKCVDDVNAAKPTPNCELCLVAHKNKLGDKN